MESPNTTTCYLTEDGYNFYVNVIPLTRAATCKICKEPAVNKITLCSTFKSSLFACARCTEDGKKVHGCVFSPYDL